MPDNVHNSAEHQVVVAALAIPDTEWVRALVDLLVTGRNTTSVAPFVQLAKTVAYLRTLSQEA